MKHILLALSLVASPAAFSQPVVEETITPQILAEFLSIESFEVAYDLPATPVDLNLQLYFTTFDEQGKQKDDSSLAGVGQLHSAPPTPTKQKLLLMASPDKTAVFSWDETAKRYGCTAWSQGWKALLEKVEQNTSSFERYTAHLTIELNKRSILKTWTKDGRKVAELSFAVTTRPLPAK